MTPGSQRKSTHPRTLVTGGAGFLGSHLCDRLIAEGHEVVCLDNLLTGTPENLQDLLSYARFRFLQHDVIHPIDPETLFGALSEGDRPFAEPFDYILHLASPASPKDYQRYPVLTLQAGSLGTYHALELARIHRSVFLLASSSEVYGDPEVTPQPEEYWGRVNPVGPRSVYDEAKRFAEAMTMAYHREYGLEIHIARLFNTYGERMRVNDGRVLPNFIMRALQEKPLTVYGEGQQTRSFCYASDMVEGLYRFLLSGEIGPLNLGNPEEVSILEFAQDVIELTGSRSQIVFHPLPVDDPQRRRPDISKATKILGWEPKVGRREGIRRVIPYFRAQLRKQITPSCEK
jgi:dTDP-glucose 4,6-dehydratase